MDVLRDHRQNDHRHDRGDHRVRCNVNRRDHHVMDDRHVNRRSDLRDDDHRLPLDDRHRMDCFCGACLLMVVNLSIHNHDHRVDLSIDPPCYYVDDLKLGVNLVVSLCHRMNDLLDDRNLDDDLHDQNLVVNRVNRNYVRRDQKMVVMMDASRGLHMNDLLDDQSLVDDHRDVPVGHRMNVMDVPNDLMTDGNLDASRDLRMSDRLDDRNLDDDRHDVLGDLR